MARSAAQLDIGVEVGQRVNYIMADGTLRPFDVVRVNGNRVSGILLIDGTNDAGNMPFNWLPEDVKRDHTPELPVVRNTVAHGDEFPICSIWLQNVEFSEDDQPGTFHLNPAEDTSEMDTLRKKVDDLHRQLKQNRKRDKRKAEPEPEEQQTEEQEDQEDQEEQQEEESQQ